MNICEINPFVRQATLANMALGNRISYKLKTKDHRLFYILGGSGSIVIEGKPYAIRPGLLVFFLSGTEYIWQTVELRYLAINFDFFHSYSHLKRSFHVHRSERLDCVLEPDIHFSDATRLNAPIVMYDAAAHESSLLQIVAEFSLSDEYTEAYVSALMKALLINIQRSLSATATKTACGAVHDIIRYMQENYHRPIKVTQIAKDLHFNASYMNRLFKSHTGMTVRAFLIDFRINAAIDLVSSSDMTVNDLAYSVGFQDVPHFIKTFKAHTGLTPTEYRSRAFPLPPSEAPK